KINEGSSSLKVLKDGQLVEKEKIELNSSSDFQTVRFNLKAEEVGLQRYTVVLEGFEGEVNLENNKRDFYIDVLDGRQQILLLYDGPHPDIAAINSALKAQK